MKNLLLMVTLSILFAGCSSKKEDCSINGVKVDCSEMNGRKDQGPKPKQAVEVQASVSGKYEIKNNVFKALSPMKIAQSKIVGDTTYSCRMDMQLNTESTVRVDEREIGFTKEGSENIFTRLPQTRIDARNLHIGKFESFDKLSNIKLTLNFVNQDTLEVQAICYFNNK